MMLSRLLLHPLNREVARCVRDAQRLHAMVLSAFGPVPAAARAAHGALHRLDVDAATGALVLYVQSRELPDWSVLPAGMLAPVNVPNPAVRSIVPVLESIRTGTSLVFRLRANVTRKIDTKSPMPGTNRNGRRVPLRSDEARLAWIARKASQHGFELASTAHGGVDVSLTLDAPSRGHRAGVGLKFEGVRYDGRLRVTDADRFRTALSTGIGPAKAYGFGLLSVAPG